MPQPDSIMNHEKYELMCALAAAHELTVAGQREFDAHIAQCDMCRQELSGFRQALDRVADDAFFSPPALDEALHASRFANFAEAQGLKLSCSARDALGIGNRSLRGRRMPVFAWVAASAVVVIAVSGVVLVSRATHPVVLAVGAPASPVVVQPGPGPQELPTPKPLEWRLKNEQENRAQVHALQGKLASAEETAASLQTQLSQRDTEIVQLRSSAADLERQLRDAQTTIATLNGKNDDLVASLVAERAQQSEAAAQIRDEKLKAEQDRQLTAATREVRELMGARRLYMIDVYDGADTSHANRSFGRVFYTEGKSLIFYAFDLDKIKSSKRVTFAAWGERGKDAGTVRPLGVFNLEDANQKRWVMKVDDPDKLKSIDAIFVTVESTPGSDRPSGQKLLYAYLGGQPNHP